MGFKIDSLNSMKNIASTVSDLSSSVKSTNQKVISSIEALKNGISGGGIEVTLPKLSNAISTYGDEIAKLLSDIATFINTQVEAYSFNEEDVAKELEKINALLDSMEV